MRTAIFMQEIQDAHQSSREEYEQRCEELSKLDRDFVDSRSRFTALFFAAWCGLGLGALFKAYIEVSWWVIWGACLVPFIMLVVFEIVVGHMSRPKSYEAFERKCQAGEAYRKNREAGKTLNRWLRYHGKYLKPADALEMIEIYNEGLRRKNVLQRALEQRAEEIVKFWKVQRSWSVLGTHFLILLVSVLLTLLVRGFSITVAICSTIGWALAAPVYTYLKFRRTFSTDPASELVRSYERDNKEWENVVAELERLLPERRSFRPPGFKDSEVKS